MFEKPGKTHDRKAETQIPAPKTVIPGDIELELVVGSRSQLAPRFG